MKKLLLLLTFLGFVSGIFAQVSKTVNLATAGTLSSSLASNELTTITNLTLTGTIDARDFKTMRDKMPLLALLDLGGVTIVKYYGTFGTGTTNTVNYDYPADAIPDYAFLNRGTEQGKKSLILVLLPSSITSIGDYAFYNCKGLTTVAITSSVRTIRKYAFYGCTELTSVTIPSSATDIGMFAFSGCTGLTTVAIPFSVTSIQTMAFTSSSGLITVDSNNPNYSSLDGVLYDKAQTTLIHCPITKIGSFAIPSSVTYIQNYAFRHCSGLTTVTIPSSVTSIGGDAFTSCSGLTTVTIPSSVTMIGSYVFKNCSGLSTITIPSSLTSIANGAFSGCSGLTTVSIPSSVTSIGRVVFSGCSGLTTVTIPLVTSIGEMAFLGCSKLTSLTTSKITPINLNSSVFEDINKLACTLYVPVGSGKAYRAANGWKDFTNIVEKNLTGIASIISDQQLTIYPNPTTGKVKLVFDQIPQVGSTLTVNDFYGKTILIQFIQNKEEWVDLAGNSPGVYLIRTNMKNFKAQKVILK